jgi:hypothetical protein
MLSVVYLRARRGRQARFGSAVNIAFVGQSLSTQLLSDYIICSSSDQKKADICLDRNVSFSQRWPISDTL